MRYSAKSFSGEEEKTSCTASDESETLPGILRNSAITLFILDSSYSSKLVTLVSICLSPTHYFWCLQSPLFNIFRVFSLHSGFILKLNPFRCSWKCVSPQEFACYGRNAVKKKKTASMFKPPLPLAVGIYSSRMPLNPPFVWIQAQ